ncbi:hypothetical protein KY363_05920 [Candidatus Woesearchaeota archaeon]|nr:hypothetical protein [Candidatus Woesearchaeota archaeon]
MVKDPSLFTPSDWQAHLTEVTGLEEKIAEAESGISQAFVGMDAATKRFISDMTRSLGVEYSFRYEHETRRSRNDPDIQAEILTTFKVTMPDGSNTTDVPKGLVKRVAGLNDLLKREFSNFQTGIDELYRKYDKARSELKHLTFAELLATGTSPDAAIYYNDTGPGIVMRAIVNLETGKVISSERTAYPAKPTDMDKKAMAQDVMHRKMSAYFAWHTSEKVSGNNIYETARNHLVFGYRQAHSLSGPVAIEQPQPDKGTVAVYEWRPTKTDVLAYELMTLQHKKGDA